MALSQELVQSIDGGLEGGNVILNIDMEKAYDRLNWEFLFAVLKKFGFSLSWVELIKNCVKDNYFSVLIDGSSSEFFASSRGLRQGDPISPALFVLAEEVLSRGISYMVENQYILPYHVLNKCPLVTHSLFADDTIIFLNGRRSSLECAMSFLKAYQTTSG